MDKKFKIRDWVLELPKKGRFTFSTDEIYRQFNKDNSSCNDAICCFIRSYSGHDTGSLSFTIQI
jgi:hypothetical protein